MSDPAYGAAAALASTTTDRLRRFTLPNGLRVVLAPERGTGVCAVGLRYGVGFRSDPPGRPGLAHLLEHLMFRRRSRPGGPGSDVPDRAGPAGGYANAATGQDSTDFHQVVPAGLLESALAAERDRMAGPPPGAAALAAEREVVAEEIRRNVTGRPYGGFPKSVLPPLLYRDHAHTHDGYGDPETLARVTPQECRDFFDRHHVPGNAVLTVVGGFDPEAARRLIERRFGDLPARPVPATALPPEPEPTADRYGRHTDPLAPLPAVCVGYRLPDPVADLPGYLAHVLLAALVEQRLRERLVTRENTAVAVTAGCGLVGGAFAARHPVTLACTVTHTESIGTRETVDALDTELAALATHGPGPDELLLVANRWISGLLRHHDEPHARARSLGTFELLHGDATLHRRVPRLLASTAPAATAAAARRLSDSHRAVLTLVPRDDRPRPPSPGREARP
ncbi:M16 family metallopeptidase [Streptomyces sp. NPDC014734]|uniref:M16 family metallopeptidase n=1 Tax=Streptomyces sp. NPDC014734 TaxID=3364886 RepID=UPI0036F5575A